MYRDVARKMVNVLIKTGYENALKRCVDILQGESSSNIYRFLNDVFVDTCYTQPAEILILLSAYRDNYFHLTQKSKLNQFVNICSLLHGDILVRIANILTGHRPDSVISGVLREKAYYKILS